jgi:hypothetical protein
MTLSVLIWASAMIRVLKGLANTMRSEGTSLDSAGQKERVSTEFHVAEFARTESNVESTFTAHIVRQRWWDTHRSHRRIAKGIRLAGQMFRQTQSEGDERADGVRGRADRHH